MTPAELRLAIAHMLEGADGPYHGAELALRVVREAMREPTHEQVNSGGIAILETRLAQERQPIHSGAGDQAAICWRAMLAASPLREE